MISSSLLPLLLCIPHAGLDVPSEVESRLAINPTTIYNECDLWADQLYDFSEAHAVLARVTMPIARVLVDANRPSNDWDNPDGAVKTQTSYGEQVYRKPLALTERRLLQRRYWQPMHQRLHAAIRQHAAATMLFLDCHNMAQVGPDAYGDPGAQRPYICLANLGDSRGEEKRDGSQLSCSPELIRAAAVVAQELFTDLELLQPDATSADIVAINRPFAGGFILREAAAMLAAVKGTPVPSIMIEVNRGLFVGRQNPDTPITPPNYPRIAAVRTRIVQWAVRVLELISNER